MSVGGSPDQVDPLLDDAGSRRSRILGGPRRGRPEGSRAVWIAVVSTVVFFTVLVVAVINAPGWLEVKEAFFNGEQFKESFPDIARAFLVNVKLFLIAEVFILVLALFLAVMRSLPGPVFFPFRALAVGYIDLFRGIPTVLVIYMLGFGAPALGRERSEVAVLLGGGLAGARLLGLRRRGVPGRHRVGPREPERGGPLAGALPVGVAAVRGPAAGRSGA